MATVWFTENAADTPSRPPVNLPPQPEKDWLGSLLGHLHDSLIASACRFNIQTELRTNYQESKDLPINLSSLTQKS